MASIYDVRKRLTFVDRYLRHRRETDALVAGAGTSANRRVSEIKAEQVGLLYRQLPPAMFATAVISILVIWVLRTQVPRVWLAGWFAALTLVTMARLLLMRIYLD